MENEGERGLVYEKRTESQINWFWQKLCRLDLLISLHKKDEFRHCEVSNAEQDEEYNKRSVQITWNEFLETVLET